MGLALAGSQRKTRIGNDPRNTQWANDTSRFGHQHMLRMGWKPGRGLGASFEGGTSHVKVKVKTDSRGLGSKPAHEDQPHGLDVFQRILGRLNGDEAAVERRIADKRRMEGVYLSFVPGGLLQGTLKDSSKEVPTNSSAKKPDQETSLRDSSDISKDKSKAESKDTPKDKSKSKKSKRSRDANKESKAKDSKVSKSTPKSRKDREKTREALSKALSQGALGTEHDTKEPKISSPESKSEIEDFDHKSKSKSKSESKSKSKPESASKRDSKVSKSKSKSKSEHGSKSKSKSKSASKSTSKKSDSNKTPSEPAQANSQPSPESTSTDPEPQKTDHRGIRATRSRYIAMKRQATADAKSLREILML